jgi:hypothetical protein
MTGIDLTGKVVEECGWAGPLLWVCTTDDYAVHLFDARIELDGTEVNAPDDIDSKLSGDTIAAISANEDRFAVTFGSGKTLQVAGTSDETARMFKRRSQAEHIIYRAGVLGEDTDE